MEQIVVEETEVTKKKETQDYPKGHNNIGIKVMFMIRKNAKRNVIRFNMSFVAKGHKQNIMVYYEKIFVLYI